jgi:3-deoxy-7-phosphoheptulonate synthase
MQPLENVNVRATVPLSPPRELKAELPPTERTARTILESRETIKRILSGADRRLLAIIGPCSIHDPVAALEYADRVRDLAGRVADQIFVSMRVYFEKPRTTVGWRGLINDPHLNGSFDMAAGFRLARKVLLHVGELGVAAATEMLEPITPQYIADLVSWAAIGARTTESPTHRQMSSGLSMPVGYKNGTDGSLQTALDAMIAARTPHSFLGIDNEGRTCVVHSKGNPWGHLILRGGRSGPNYTADLLRDAEQQLDARDLPARLLVDCSHANSGKDHRRQRVVWQDVIAQRIDGDDRIVGLMLESNLEEGAQSPDLDPAKLRYGVSVTDPCIGWNETEELLVEARARLAESGACSPR